MPLYMHSQQHIEIYFAFFFPFQIRKRHNKWTGMLYISGCETDSDAGIWIFRKQNGKNENESILKCEEEACLYCVRNLYL